jgi:hypothetical protein
VKKHWENPLQAFGQRYRRKFELSPLAAQLRTPAQPDQPSLRSFLTAAILFSACVLTRAATPGDTALRVSRQKKKSPPPPPNLNEEIICLWEQLKFFSGHSKLIQTHKESLLPV